MTDTLLQTDNLSYSSLPVPDNMFRDYVKGNVLLPQCGAGFNTYFIQEVVNGDRSFTEFYRTILSASQIDTIGKTMANVHKQAQHSIPIIYTGAADVGDGSNVGHANISDFRLHTLWNDIKENALVVASKVFDVDTTSAWVPQLQAEKLDKVISYSSNEELVARVRNTTAAMIQGFSDRRFNKVSVRYRNQVSHRFLIKNTFGEESIQIKDFDVELDRTKVEVVQTLSEILRERSGGSELDYGIVDKIFVGFV